MRAELVQLHTARGGFKGNTPKEGGVIGLLSKTLGIWKDFEQFREKLKFYMEYLMETI